MTHTEKTLPYKVRTGCGHIVIRRMREATAGVPYTESTVIEAPNGRPCEACEKGQHASDCTAWVDEPCNCVTGGGAR